MMRRINSKDLDNEALAFEPVLGSMLARVYHNPQMKEESQLKLQKLVQFWASKEIYDQDTINALEGEMINGIPTKALPGHPKELSATVDSAAGRFSAFVFVCIHLCSCLQSAFVRILFSGQMGKIFVKLFLGAMQD